MKDCWKFVPGDRPTFCTLVELLCQKQPEFEPVELELLIA